MSAGLLQLFECFRVSQNDAPPGNFSILVMEKSHKDLGQANKEAEKPQECHYWPKTRLLIAV